MANKFITHQNQDLMWDVICRSPQIQQHFAYSPPGTKEGWFGNIISFVYNKHKFNNLSLKELNRIALDTMIASIEQQPQPQPHLNQQPYVVQKPGVSVANNVESEYEMRRKEYESMTKKNIPSINFAENSIKDEAIADINSAVNEYMKQRELDIKVNSTLPSTPMPKIKLSLDENFNTPIDAIDITHSEKKVTWGENTEHIIHENSLSINSLFDKLQSMDNKLNQILSFIEKQSLNN